MVEKLFIAASGKIKDEGRMVVKSLISRMAMTAALIAMAGVFTCSHGQISNCTWGRVSTGVFNYTLWRQPTASELSFWAEKAEAAGYKMIGGGLCGLITEDKKKLISSIMDWAIADQKEPRFQTTEVSRMVDRVFENATRKPANQPEHTIWDKVVRQQKTTAPELFPLITPDLVIKEVTDVANSANAENVHIVNQGKFATRVGSVLRLEITNGPGCSGTVAKQAEFSVPILKAGEDIWVKVTSTERLRQTGLERSAYKLTLDAKRSVAESNENNNERCMPAYVIK